MRSLIVNGIHYRHESIQWTLPRLHLPMWLEHQNIYPKVYWKDKRSHMERVALGNILSFQEIPSFGENTDPSIHFYGGMRFPSGKNDDIWAEFPACRFHLPAFEVIQTQDTTKLTAHFIDEHPSKKSKDQLVFDRVSQSKNRVLLLKKEESCSFEEWTKQLSQLLNAINSQSVHKVVLAKKTTLYFSHPLSVWDRIDAFGKDAQESTIFAFQMSPHVAFTGATPETLFHRQKESVRIDALAATRRRGTSPEEDEILEHQLQNDSKDRHEFSSVKDFITRTAHRIFVKSTWNDKDAILKTAYVQHLHNCMHGFLKKGITDRELIAALHPTPAVGGFPREEALRWISSLESFHRGWYGAPIGWISPSETHMAVALRCGLIQDSTLHLFAGAGIVAQSDAEKEWEEIDHKMRFILHGCGLAK